jgi:aspartate kinase
VFDPFSIQTVRMPVVVQKYGGTSVADPGRIQAVADRVTVTRTEGNDVVVVVSAMGKTTDELASLAAQISSSPTPREMDMLLTAGERVSMALLAIALHDRGVPAVSYTGSQAGILTDSSHGEARITRITGERVRESIGDGKVVIIAGFQGVDPVSKEITTLGRGGSDTTAVALAAALDAEGCEILTDVEGVYTADPRAVPSARKLDSIGYDDMLSMAYAGAAVLMPHSVEHARDSGIRVHVRSSFSNAPGTWLTDLAPQVDLVGLAHASGVDEGRISLVGTGAAEVATSALELMIASGIDARDGGSDDRMARFRVHVERIPEALRLLHQEFFESERS